MTFLIYDLGIHATLKLPAKKKMLKQRIIRLYPGRMSIGFRIIVLLVQTPGIPSRMLPISGWKVP
jgi:hypothetical protein